MQLITGKSFSQPASQREAWIDFIKGLMICLVVLGHCISSIGATETVNKDILILIYTVHMPAFFILSGYTLKTNKTLGKFWHSKVIKILIPYVTFAIIDTALQIILGEYTIAEVTADFQSNWINIILITTKSRFSSLWFLPVITAGLLIAFTLEKYIRNKRLIVAISVGLILVNQLWYLTKIESVFGVREALVAQAFIIIGFELKTYLRKLKCESNLLIFFIFLVGWGYSCIEWIHFGQETVNYWNSDIAPISWTFGMAMFGMLFFVCLAGIWDHHKGIIYRVLCALGKITIYIYGLHYAFLRTIPNYLPKSLNETCRIIISFICILVISYILIKLYLMIKQALVNKFKLV